MRNFCMNDLLILITHSTCRLYALLARALATWGRERGGKGNCDDQGTDFDNLKMFLK